MNRTLAGIGAAVGLAALAAGCGDKTEVSAIGEKIVLARPEGCEKLTGIGYQIIPGETYDIFQLHCEQDGGLVLYSRKSNDAEWTSITVK